MSKLDSSIYRVGMMNAQLHAAKEIFEQISNGKLSEAELQSQAKLGIQIIIGSRETLEGIEKSLSRLNTSSN